MFVVYMISSFIASAEKKTSNVPFASLLTKTPKKSYNSQFTYKPLNTPPKPKVVIVEFSLDILLLIFRSTITLLLIGLAIILYHVI